MSTNAPRTVEEHARRLAKLVLLSNAYSASREKTVTHVRRYMDEYFHLISAPSPTFHTQHPDQIVRVHLRQALLLGHGKGAKYAHTLIGERQQPLGEQYGGTNFVAVHVLGFVRGGVTFNLEHPTLHRLASNNILSIEDAKIDHVCTEGC